MPFWRVALPITRQIRRFSIMAQDSGWHQVPATTDIPAHSVLSKPIEKPETDDRDYRLIKLQNGLQALLIHDPKADKAAAAMDVGVGHLSDPVRTIFSIPSFFS
jgi:insulysin